MEGDDVNNETVEETPQEVAYTEDNEAESVPQEEPTEYDEAISHDQTEADSVDEGNEIENTDESNSLLTDPDKGDSGPKVSKSKFFSLTTDKKFFDVDSTEIRKMESASSHAYHFKRKYNFRSDSVFSDVTPMPTSSTEANKSSETRDKCGSLSSLKSRESRWVSLRRKLGKVSQSNSSGPKKQTEGKEKSSSTLAEKRSLFQRAKTLSILPINRGPKEEPAPRVKEQPPELFNVGGEMNLIPLELLIDINDLQLRK